MGFKDNLLTCGRKALFNLKKYSPELMTAGAIIFGIGTVAATWVAARKHDEALAEPKKMIETAKSMELTDTYTKKDQRHDIFLGYVKGAAAIVKLYGFAALMGSASAACTIGSYKVLEGRNAGLIAVNGILGKQLSDCENYISENYGEEELNKMRQFGKTTKITETTVGENGETTTEEKLVAQDGYEDETFDRMFDEYCPVWAKDAQINLAKLRGLQATLTNMGRARRVLFLNDVYEELRMPKTQAGYQYGWIFPKGVEDENYVSFGLPLGNKEWEDQIILSNERNHWLHFNCTKLVWSEAPFPRI